VHLENSRVTDFRNSLKRLASEAFYLDQARPIEWLSLAALAGWLQFLLSHPAEFASPRYSAFSSLPPMVWATVVAGVIVAQLIAMPSWRYSAIIRFVAMTLAAGLWTVIALSFWSSDSAPISARTFTVIALASAVTAVHLGLARKG
jgi:hypothetical protein